MLDWLASKAGVLLAVGVVTVFVIGLFHWQQTEAVDGEGQSVADSVSAIVDSVAGLDAAVRLNITFGETGRLPDSIGGERYSVNISQDMVVVRAGDRMWTAGIMTPCIPRNVTDRQLNLTEFRNLDFSGWTGEHLSSGCFTIERAAVDVSGRNEYLTLAYWEQT